MGKHVFVYEFSKAACSFEAADKVARAQIEKAAKMKGVDVDLAGVRVSEGANAWRWELDVA